MLKPMLFVTPKFGRAAGGVGISCDRITRQLRGHTWPIIVSIDTSLVVGECEARAEDEAGRLHYVMHPRGGAEGGQFVADVVQELCARHAVTRVAAFYAAELAYPAVIGGRLAGARTYVFGRGNDIDLELFGRDGALALRAMALSDRVFTVTTEMARKVSLHVPEAKTTVVFNSVDGAQFAPSLAARRASDDARIHVGVVGELKSKKGLPILLEALNFERCTLTVAGTLRDDVRKQVHGFLQLRPELEPLIRFEPWQSDPAAMVALYHRLDVVCLPSLHDGMPNVLLEAMACGRVVVATAVGGALDLVRDGENGFLCAPRCEDELGRAIARACNYLRATADTKGVASVGAIERAARSTVLDLCTPEQERAAYVSALDLPEAPQ